MEATVLKRRGLSLNSGARTGQTRCRVTTATVYHTKEERAECVRSAPAVVEDGEEFVVGQLPVLALAGERAELRRPYHAGADVELGLGVGVVVEQHPAPDVPPLEVTFRAHRHGQLCTTTTGRTAYSIWHVSASVWRVGVNSTYSAILLLRDTMRKRGLCCRPVSVCLSVCHVGVLYPRGQRYRQTSFSVR